MDLVVWAQPLVFALYKNQDQLLLAKNALQTLCGGVDFEGEEQPFEGSYYEPEMGGPLFRKLLGLAEPVCQSWLVDLKRACVKIENELAISNKRQVNLDPGFVDRYKFVLASNKERANKIYLGENCFADMTLYWDKGAWQRLAWTFPGFKLGTYDADLTKLRSKFLAELKRNRLSS